ncbi:adenylyltransferase/cytidyltransferase family protein [Candidatus Saccharibacteria bacterium]|nr:adenylyltransferase/cytidyltransferase family protein [Candidatus Saccharibacteria bacterium]
MKSRIGIYSGTFDPVHDGHIAFANAALKQCNLDKIFFLVEPRPRRKQGVKAFEHRTEMVRLAIKNEHSLGSIVLNQQRFTPADTLPLLTERFKGADLYMLIGDDMLDHLAGWPHVECLLQSFESPSLAQNRLSSFNVSKDMSLSEKSVFGSKIIASKTHEFVLRGL